MLSEDKNNAPINDIIFCKSKSNNYLLTPIQVLLIYKINSRYFKIMIERHKSIDVN